MSLGAHRHTAAEKRIGQLLRGKWLLLRVIGLGGMGAVYEARHKNGKRVAVKMLHAHLAADPRVLRRFVREGYVANSLSHPSVVSIDDNDVDEEGNAFLVMELLFGESLEERRLRAGGSLRPSEVVPLFALLLDVLVLAGDQGIVHRDLKPENLFLHEDGTLRVVDFGLARAREVGASNLGAMTTSGELMGTPAFMAPEQAIGRWDLVDPRTDVWAAGATMFTVLAGRPVHDGGNIAQIIVSAATRTAPPLATLVPDVHPLLARVVDRALAFSKAERPDAREVLRDLVEAARALSIPLPPLPDRPAPASPPLSSLRPEMELDLDGDRDPPSATDASLPGRRSSSVASAPVAGRVSSAAAFAPTLASEPPPAPPSAQPSRGASSSGVAAHSRLPPARPGSAPVMILPVAILATLAGAAATAFLLRPVPPAREDARAIAVGRDLAPSTSASTPASSSAPSPVGPLPGNAAASASTAPVAKTAADASARKRIHVATDLDSELLLEKRK